MKQLPTYGDVVAASERLVGLIHRTPVFTSRLIDARARATVFCKAENLQKVGAFKARGAMNAVLSLSEADRMRGVVTHSSGNHGQALAYAASVAGTSAIIVMPDHAPEVKVAAVESYGATIVTCAQSERDAVVEQLIAETGRTLVHPFEDPMVIAGQGTAALELVNDIAGLDVVITPIGGGGLLSGTTIVCSENGIGAVGAEPHVVDDSARSLRDGIRYPATGSLSVGDGLLTGIGAAAFQILSSHGIEILTVDEEAILEAMRFVVTRTKQVIEPSAATAFAAVFANPDRFAGRRVGLIVSGGNVDLARLGSA